MPNVVIQNPILNSPFREPTRHFHFDEQGITDTVIEGRRESEYFMPVPASRKKKGAGQLAFETEWTQDRIEKNKLVNDIRERVSLWRKGGYQGITATTRRLLDHWTDEERSNKLFFCQIEALETAIYIAEVAHRYGDAWIGNQLVDANAMSNPGLPRIALKMATGSGKTVVMAMLIAWQALNKLEHKQDNRFSDTFLVITPGITIRDRLRVLLPSDPENYYQQRDLLPPGDLERLHQSTILITNFHALQLREKVKASKVAKSILGGDDSEVFKETPDEMVRRVCRGLGTKKQIIVLNDEAHHCYRRRPDGTQEKLDREEKQEAKQRDEEARLWINGIEAVKNKIGVKAIYDLSATPFFLRGSGYSEGTLFPWVVSDFSLVDAIESGIVKVPRVPIADDSMTGDMPTYRNLWYRIRDELPKKGRKTDSVEGTDPQLPKELEGALWSLYNDYEKRYRRWEEQERDRPGGTMPPVFIVVCNNTNVSKMVYDYIGGWDREIDGQKVTQQGKLPLFRNDDEHGGWLGRPNTILVDSQQLESGEGMSKEFKQVASREIEEFKQEYRQRYPGRDVNDITDDELLREVMNTVGKRGRLGEHVRCVVSVSMLTEGWDANSVTHILGIRAFGTQLLCEQVVGRALRRMSYAPDEQGMFAPEYAEVYGVPFSFIPAGGAEVGPARPPVIPTRVRALPERAHAEITFPRLSGYRFEIPDGTLRADFSNTSPVVVSTEALPSKTQVAGSIGETVQHEMYDTKNKRRNTVAFEIARVVLERYFRDDGGAVRPWLFPQVLEITKQWIDKCVVLKDGTTIGWLTIGAWLSESAESVYASIVQGEPGTPRLLPIMRPYDPIGSTQYVDFDTTKPTLVTDPDKCHVSHVVADTDIWEQKVADVLERMDEVIRYVKNEGLGFSIPYTLEGKQKNYIPDFIAHIDLGGDEPLNLIIEVSGEQKRDKARKAETARDFWIPAVNNHGGFGTWSYLEVVDPWSAESLIRGHIEEMVAVTA